MDRNTELELLTQKLQEIKKELNALFASQVELKVNHQWLQDSQEAIHIKDQELKLKCDFISRELSE